MYFNFAFNLYMTMSPADNPFKQIGPRSGSTLSGPDRGPNCLTLKRLWQVEVEPMYFNFAFNLFLTLSSADNPFKQFEPRSSPTFCPDLIGVQTVWHFRGYDKLKLNSCILTLCYPLINFSNNFEQDQAWHSVRSENVWPDRGPNCSTL